MSAFLVSTRTINQIVAGISLLVKQSEPSWLSEKFAEVGFDMSQAGWKEQLANALFALNAQAVAQRYGEPAATRFSYTPVEQVLNVYQLLKSINCWLYQCTEGDVPQHRLYQFFREVVVLWLLKYIVYRLPKYETANWG